MIQKVSSSLKFGDTMLKELQDMQRSSQTEGPSSGKSEGKTSFFDHLKEAMNEVNKEQITADAKAVDLANGKDTNIHDTMLAASQAELSFNLMVQVRNKGLEAYHEIMRMPV